MNQPSAYPPGVAHPLPCGDPGLNFPANAMVLFGSKDSPWSIALGPECSHWCWVELPEIPKPCTQADIDTNAFREWWGTPNSGEEYKTALRIWMEAVSYERSTAHTVDTPPSRPSAALP